MAKSWLERAQTKESTALTFDGTGWSMKYNLIWDKVLQLDLLPETFYETETAGYLSRMNEYGLPLDSRADYTKSDWIPRPVLRLVRYKNRTLCGLYRPERPGRRLYAFSDESMMFRYQLPAVWQTGRLFYVSDFDILTVLISNDLNVRATSSPVPAISSCMFSSISQLYTRPNGKRI